MRDALRDWKIDVREDSMDADAVIIWSVLWSGRMAGNQAIYEHYRRSSKPVIIVDIGSLQRGVTWKIALNNINGEGWFGEDIDLDLDRPIKLAIRRPRGQGSDILIAAQHRRSLQTCSIPSMEQWVMEKIRHIRDHSDRPIVIRPHPRDPLNLDRLPSNIRIDHPKRLSGTYDSFDWSDDWHAVVNHNSGPGVLAGIAGVRPVAHASSLAWPVAVNIEDIESPYDLDRESWLIRIAHTEYTLDEISQGRWLKRLCSRL